MTTLSIQSIQWIILLLVSIGLVGISPIARNAAGFFAGVSKSNTQPGFFLLTSSLVISWIFAKSITNAANLGLEFGIVGGLAYAVYYFSFLVAGIVIYQLRMKGGFQSLYHYLSSQFGRSAILLFSLLISIRLFNEVWSNTMIIGSYFGEIGSMPYVMAIITFTGLTLIYSLRGGLRSSLITDLIQMMLFGILLLMILSAILPQYESVRPIMTSGKWTMATGLNLLFVAALQVFSYPFHDPVLTDRAFISGPRTMLHSFIAATGIGFSCILLFSFVGIHGRLIGMEGEAVVQVSQTLGVIALLAVNTIMVTSAASTLDSTFSSVSKLAIVDLNPTGNPSITKGRLAMVITAVAGSLPLFFSPEIIQATTISGTMVLGLAPVFLLWKLNAPRISFHLSVWTGIIIGLILTFNLLPEQWQFTDGRYADLFTLNVIGALLCFGLYCLPIPLRRWFPNSAAYM